MKPPKAPAIESITPHSFKNASLLQLALTHSSCEHPDGDNQRLEFLGDAVLDLVIAETLFQKFPQADEGALDRSRAGIVNGKSLARVAIDKGLAAHLQVGEAHRLHHPDPSKAMLEDAIEALIGAVYLDGGIEAARETILHLFGEQIDAIEPSGGNQNPKGRLQEWSQKSHDGEVPAYEALPPKDHDRRYSAAVSLGGQELGRGTGSSKKAAEAAAAKAALKALG